MENKQINSDNLKDYDIVVMIDKSGSMSTEDCAGNRSRFAAAQEYAESIAREAGKHDADGIDVVVFGNTPKEYKNVTSEKVTQVFKENSPAGGTDTAAALELVLKGYRDRKATGSAKPILIVCITDGAPNDQKAVDTVIINHTKTMDEDGETGIQFVQIGKDAGARAFLKHLDDDLEAAGARFDIVDTKNEEEMDNISIVELLCAAVAD